MKKLIIIMLAALTLAGCDDKKTDDNDYVSVTEISGVSSVVEVNKPLLLAATVLPSDATNKTIAWSVKNAGSTGATVSGDKLNATAAGIVSVTATIVGGSTPTTPFITDFSITVKNPADMPVVTGVSVTPSSVNVVKGGSQKFSATVSGTKLEEADKIVNWTVTGGAKTGTTIGSDGTLAVAADETAASLTVKATSAIENTKSGTATVTVTATVIQTIDIYTAGYEINAEGIQVGKVWKNDKLLHSLEAVKHASVESVFVTDNDVYVAGYESTNTTRVAKVWKNGDVLYSFAANDATFDAYATDIYVSGTDVYIAGYDLKFVSSTSTSIGWVRKNDGILYYLPNALSVSSMYVSNGDIYVCGSSKDFWDRRRSTFWKNGVRTIVCNTSSASGTNWSFAYDIAVLGNTVYVAGYTPPSRQAQVWRYVNSVVGLYTFYSATSINPQAYAYSFDVTGTSAAFATVYTVVTSATDKVYKNNTELYSFSGAKITDISVKNDDVYLVGYGLSGNTGTVKVWKNGEELYVLTDGTNNARANAIFVVTP